MIKTIKRIKLFSGLVGTDNGIQSIQEEVNKFLSGLEEKDILDIHIKVTQEPGMSPRYDIMIVYRE